jgi:hypothetical protein
VDLYRLLDASEAGRMRADIENDERELCVMSGNYKDTEEALYHAPMRDLQEAEDKAIASSATSS